MASYWRERTQASKGALTISFEASNDSDLVRTIYRSCINTGSHSSGHIAVILLDPVTRMELSNVCVTYYSEHSGVLLLVDYRSRSTSSRIY